MAKSRNISIILSLLVVAWQAQMMLPRAVPLDYEEQTPREKPVKADVAARPDSAFALMSLQLPVPPTSAAKKIPKTISLKHTASASASKRLNASNSKFAALSSKQKKYNDLVKHYEPLQPQSPPKLEPVKQNLQHNMIDATTGEQVKETVNSLEIISLKRKNNNEENQETMVVDMPFSTVQSGGTWLRILEHGEGPNIEITWPTGTQGARLFDKLIRCYGLTLAINDLQGRLFADRGERGVKWDINLDLYSGFMRQTGSWHTSKEQLAINAIYARHGHIQGLPVRLFHRRVDARLLAGLLVVTGDSFTGTSAIQANYALEGERLIVQNLIIDGKPTPGKIDLSTTAHCVARGNT